MKKSFVFLAMLMLAATVGAAPRTKAQMQSAARQAINLQRQARHLAPDHTPLKVLRSAEQLEVIGSVEGGFAVIASDDLLPAVLGASVARYSEGRNPNFEWWLTATAEAAKTIVRSNAPLQVTTPDPGKYPIEVTPMLTTKWDQMEPYSDMCPVFSGSTRCLTGCVATAMAQVLKYHEMPEHGYGQHTIHYNGQAVTADFENDYYDWDNMLDVYTSGNYTQEQADAVALLMRDCGVAADMQYGGPDEGSGAYSSDAAEGLRRYFGFEDAECLDRDRYSEPVWMDMVYSELSENGPVYYAGADFVNGGHAFVFDGYNAEGQVSVNWGWAGEDDGFYLVSQLNPDYYHFNYGQDMIVGVKSNNHSLLRSEKVSLTKAGQLQEVLEGIDSEGIVGTLTVEGPMNMADLIYVRQLAGWDENDQPTGGRLRVLDLTNATLENNTLPDSAFKNCSMLSRVRLPESLTAIGSAAFKGCTGLGDLRVTTKAVPELLGIGVFEGMPLGFSKLYVRSGLKTKYVQAAQWGDFGEKNIFQVGTSVKVRNAIRKYGEKNPDFTYTVTGDAIEGKPVITCDAKPDSPAGRYPVYITAGTVVNPEAVNFIDGYLIVQKVDAIATVQTAERRVGEPDPQFTLSYEGLVAGDVAPAWVEEPVFVTTATANSKPGEYAVYVQSATAESYEMVFMPGKLIVKEAEQSAISELSSEAEAEAPVYNLQGQRVNASRRGLYISGGKKVVR